MDLFKLLLRKSVFRPPAELAGRAGLGFAWLALLGVFLAGCGGEPRVFGATATADFRTPVPPETLQAIWDGAPVQNAAQAAAAARQELSTTRMAFVTPPEVLSARRLDYAGALAAVRPLETPTGGPHPLDEPVWLVIFAGAYRIAGPDPLHTQTPDPPVPGCAYVILFGPELYAQMGNLPCPPDPGAAP